MSSRASELKRSRTRFRRRPRVVCQKAVILRSPRSSHTYQDMATAERSRNYLPKTGAHIARITALAGGWWNNTLSEALERSVLPFNVQLLFPGPVTGDWLPSTIEPPAAQTAN